MFAAESAERATSTGVDVLVLSGTGQAPLAHRPPASVPTVLVTSWGEHSSQAQVPSPASRLSVVPRELVDGCLADAVRLVALGYCVIPPSETAEAAATGMRDGFEHTGKEAKSAETALAQRLEAVHEGIRRGLNNREIAGELNVSVSTVKARAAALYAQLGVANRVQAAAWQVPPAPAADADSVGRR
ncbi:response regulator transcription factor [Streptomyces sp. NBC_01465]|uniref:response regulator transcription factor n=1 Tax=Streptomyces sp. NBC_01465 TaxID=2903878 RepID=UPI002E30B9B1|nr:LuxR C-terminal-related transcriptional regulator [Streptomyces sp. NBC_01465]